MREPLCMHRPCLVVGSSKDQTRTAVSPALVVLGANGGASIARDLGLTVDVLCTTSYVFRSDRGEQEQAVVDSMRGLRVRGLYMDTQCGYQGRLDDFDILADSVHTVAGGVRRTVVREACGADLWVSTGVWAVCLALISGAKSVAIQGISLNRGHANLPAEVDVLPRDHLDEDAQCLYYLVELGANIRMSDELCLAVTKWSP